MTTDHDQDLNHWLETATRDLPPDISQLIREEIEAHFADALAEHRAQGKSPEAAYRAALADLGDVHDTARALRDTHLAKRRYFRAAAVSMAWPIFPAVVLILSSILNLPLPMQLIIFYSGTVFITLYGLQMLKRLLAERFSCTTLTQPFTTLMGGLVLYLGSALVIELLFPDLIGPGSLWTSDASIFRTIAIIGALSGGTLTGSGALWLAYELMANVRASLYGLRSLLAVALALLGAGVIIFCSGLAVEVKIVADVGFVLYISASYAAYALMALLFFRAAWRKPKPPVQLA